MSQNEPDIKADILPVATAVDRGEAVAAMEPLLIGENASWRKGGAVIQHFASSIETDISGGAGVQVDAGIVPREE